MTEAESWLACVNVAPEAAPPALEGLVRRLASVAPVELARNDPPAMAVAERQAAVLILLATDGLHGPDVLLQQRATTLRTHAGEVSSPGGSRDTGDAGPVQTAVREAIVWGYTGEVLAALLRLGGWEQPWDADRVIDLPVKA